MRRCCLASRKVELKLTEGRPEGDPTYSAHAANQNITTDRQRSAWSICSQDMQNNPRGTTRDAGSKEEGNNYPLRNLQIRLGPFVFPPVTTTSVSTRVRTHSSSSRREGMAKGTDFVLVPVGYMMTSSRAKISCTTLKRVLQLGATCAPSMFAIEQAE